MKSRGLSVFIRICINHQNRVILSGFCSREQFFRESLPSPFRNGITDYLPLNRNDRGNFRKDTSHVVSQLLWIKLLSPNCFANTFDLDIEPPRIYPYESERPWL